MTYQQEVTDTANRAVSQVLAALALYEAGKLTADALVSVVAAYVAAANSAAAALADLSLASVLTLDVGEPVPPLGLTRPADEPDRLAKGAQTILDDYLAKWEADLDAAQREAEMRMERLALAETLQAASEAYSEGIARSEHVEGWVRARDPDPCELCTWWWRNGRIWPADHPMPRHKGCECYPAPVTVKGRIRPVQT